MLVPTGKDGRALSFLDLWMVLQWAFVHVCEQSSNRGGEALQSIHHIEEHHPLQFQDSCM